ncbi:hypothetical protein HDG32_000687 [Paraburkholderia sp. CI2]|uniref:hypothetical protein n=1 Tax=Paraburkholderia sp. CI2 TaxID=2723093 RepID=UPI00160C9A8B|nr:hypothetical protein [Paraburkholderia sp. CI2]MBB5464594.1 hypothetical protein [Paraburkholderia sp. CI2]
MKQNHRSRAETCSDRAPPRPSIGDITDELDVGQHEAVRTHPAQFNILQRRQRLRICRAGLLEARHLAGALVLRGLFVIDGYVAAYGLGSFDIAFVPVFAALAHRWVASTLMGFVMAIRIRNSRHGDSANNSGAFTA